MGQYENMKILTGKRKESSSSLKYGPGLLQTLIPIFREDSLHLDYVAKEDIPEIPESEALREAFGGVDPDRDPKSKFTTADRIESDAYARFSSMVWMLENWHNHEHVVILRHQRCAIRRRIYSPSRISTLLATLRPYLEVQLKEIGTMMTDTSGNKDLVGFRDVLDSYQGRLEVMMDPDVCDTHLKLSWRQLDYGIWDSLTRLHQYAVGPLKCPISVAMLADHKAVFEVLSRQVNLWSLLEKSGRPKEQRKTFAAFAALRPAHALHLCYNASVAAVNVLSELGKLSAVKDTDSVTPVPPPSYSKSFRYMVPDGERPMDRSLSRLFDYHNLLHWYMNGSRTPTGGSAEECLRGRIFQLAAAVQRSSVYGVDPPKVDFAVIEPGVVKAFDGTLVSEAQLKKLFKTEQRIKDFCNTIADCDTIFLIHDDLDNTTELPEDEVNRYKKGVNSVLQRFRKSVGS